MGAATSRCRLHRPLLWLALVAAGMVGGCAPGTTLKRGRVHGAVTVEGVPLAKGQIRLFALAAGGVGADGEIVDGNYDIPAHRGPTAGTYRMRSNP